MQVSRYSGGLTVQPTSTLKFRGLGGNLKELWDVSLASRGPTGAVTTFLPGIIPTLRGATASALRQDTGFPESPTQLYQQVIQQAVGDEAGQPVLDANGQQVVQSVPSPVADIGSQGQYNQYVALGALRNVHPEDCLITQAIKRRVARRAVEHEANVVISQVCTNPFVRNTIDQYTAQLAQSQDPAQKQQLLATIKVYKDIAGQMVQAGQATNDGPAVVRVPSMGVVGGYLPLACEPEQGPSHISRATTTFATGSVRLHARTLSNTIETLENQGNTLYNQTHRP
jgi:hypothetical protein